MKKFLIGFIILFLLIAGAVLWLNATGQDDKADIPSNQTPLDQLDIKTGNPQPAGKNITPPSN